VPALPHNIIGREEVLRRLARLLVSQQSITVVGLPGVGKTTLAVALALDAHVLSHFTDGVLWGSLGPQPNAESILRRWGKALNRDVTHVADVQQRKEMVADAIGQRHMLIVIDDAWSTDTANSLRCGGPNCCYILTTRDYDVARSFTRNTSIETLDALPDHAAYDLLCALAPEACSENGQTAMELVRAVGGLPLALALLGSFLAAPQNRYFRQAEEEAFVKAHDPSRRLTLAQERLGGQEGRRVSLRETIEWSLDALSEDPSLSHAARTRAVEVFYSLGAFAPQPEQFDLASAQAVTQADTESIGLLLSRNLLLERRLSHNLPECREEYGLALHQTLADVARLKTPHQAVAKHRNYYLALAKKDAKDWRTIESIYGQLRWAWDNAPEDETWFEILNALGGYLAVRGLWNDLVFWASRGLTIARDRRLPLMEGKCLSRIGQAEIGLGNLEEALTALRASLAPGRFEGEGDRGTRIFNLGRVLDLMGNDSEALEHYRQALHIGEETRDLSLIAGALNNIGRVLSDHGEHDEALKYFDEGLKYFDEQPYTSHADVPNVRAFLVHNVGRTYIDQGDLERGLKYLHLALEMQKYTGNAYSNAATLHYLAVASLRQGDRTAALRYFEEALRIRTQIGDRLGQRDTLLQLAKMAEDEGRLEVVREYVKRALECEEKVGVGDSASLRQWLANLEGRDADTVRGV
jgi:tetratricopeptide (TPR) repeat protein